ncbi:MAG: KTSC domain-containing protein [Anaerolineaceae bacterium]|nr:KTSC domain-containing protein [Anaerolineaceae bacterium]
MVEHTKSVKPAKPVWEDVDSSMISAFKYDSAKKELEVMFTRTGTYRYFDVPEDVVKNLREADSKGSYMRYAIIDMFGYEKIGR